MDDFFGVLKFLRIAAWAYDGALAKATVRAAEHRRYPRGFDAPDDVRGAIGLGEVCQRHLELSARLVTWCRWVVKPDGTVDTA